MSANSFTISIEAHKINGIIACTDIVDNFGLSIGITITACTS